jgi:hypothetical protein
MIREGVAYASVSVVNADVENVLFSLVPGGSVSGSVRIDRPDSNPAIKVQLKTSFEGLPATIPGVFQPRAATLASDGTFTTPNVKAGEYRVSLEDLPQGYYVKEARVGPTDVLNKPFEFSATGSDNNRLEIVVAPGAPSVEGNVSNERLDPVPGAQVVLVPDRQRDRLDLFKAATTDSRGRFSFSNVAPGDYKVFAWEALEPNAYFDVELLRQADTRGKSIQVRESSPQTVDLRAIPAVAPF